MRQIRHSQQQALQLLLDLIEPQCRLLQLGLGGGHLRHDGAGVFALGLELTDLLGQLIALVLQLLGANLQALALGLQRLEDRHIEKRLGRLAAV